MPNQMNVEGPITLVGSGRSGSTLLTNIFRRHPKFQSLGETTNFIFSPYYYMKRALPFCGPRPNQTSVNEAAKIGVHAMLIRTYHSARPHWFHKPIMLPVVVREFKAIDDFASWYWDATRQLFPHAKFFTILRAPERVVISAVTRWKQPPARAAANLARIYRVMLHPESRVEFGLAYERLVDEPAQTLQDLFGYAGVEMHESCLSAFDRQHASNDQSAAAEVQQQFAQEPFALPSELFELHDALRERFALAPRQAAVAVAG
jgi:hypothetical protein